MPLSWLCSSWPCLTDEEIMRLAKPNVSSACFGDACAMMRRANQFERMVIIMALHTGRRLGDLTMIAWADWDGVFIQLSNSKGSKKTRSISSG
jgi:hypothetical protein